MFDENNLDTHRAVFVFALSSLNQVVEKHYEKTTHKEVLKQVMCCKAHRMQHNFVVSSGVLGALYTIYPERSHIINCIKGMLHEENLCLQLSPIDSTIKLAQLKQFEGLDVYVVTEDDKEKGYCRDYSILCLTPEEALKKIEEINNSATEKKNNPKVK